MNIYKKYRLIALGFSLISAGFVQADLISVSGLIVADSSDSWRDIFEDLRPSLALSGISTTPIDIGNHHITILGYNVKTAPDLSPEEVGHIKREMKFFMRSAMIQASGRFGAINCFNLHFKSVGLAGSKIVAFLESHPFFSEYINYVEFCFLENLEIAMNCGLIRREAILTCTKKHKHHPIDLHVSLAIIESGHGLISPEKLTSSPRTPGFAVSPEKFCATAFKF